MVSYQSCNGFVVLEGSSAGGIDNLLAVSIDLSQVMIPVLRKSIESIDRTYRLRLMSFIVYFLCMHFYLYNNTMQYLEQFQGRDIDSTKQWLNKNNCKENIDEVEHIIDYFMGIDNPNYNLTYKEAVKKSKGWVRSMSRDTTNEVEGVDYEVVHEFTDGMRFVKLLTKVAYENESANMRHCIKSYRGRDNVVYSLRDHKNLPHATMDILEEDGEVQQIQGKGNNTVDGKYEEYTVALIRKLGHKITERFMNKIGYCSVKGIEHLLVEGTKTFRGFVYGGYRQEIFAVPIATSSKELVEGVELFFGDLYLHGSSHPIPQTLKYICGSLYLYSSIAQSVYKHKLPSSLVFISGTLSLIWYKHKLPSYLNWVGGHIDLYSYDHPLPSGFLGCGSWLKLAKRTGCKNVYRHPLPETFVSCYGVYGHEYYEHKFPKGFKTTAKKKKINGHYT